VAGTDNAKTKICLWAGPAEVPKCVAWADKARAKEAPECVAGADNAKEAELVEVLSKIVRNRDNADFVAWVDNARVQEDAKAPKCVAGADKVKEVMVVEVFVAVDEDIRDRVNADFARMIYNGSRIMNPGVNKEA
jgi:hypothetical protein